MAAFLIHKKMPDGHAFFCSEACGEGWKLFNCHKFRTMTVNHNGSMVSVAGDSRITPFGAKSRPGITGPATLKCRLENEMISEYVAYVLFGMKCYHLHEGCLASLRK